MISRASRFIGPNSLSQTQTVDILLADLVRSKGLLYLFLEGLFPLPFPDGFPVLLGAFRGVPLPLLPPLLPPFFAIKFNLS